MPTYEYACRGCGQHLEVVQSFKDDALTECPSCQGELRKVFSAAGIIFKGSGWHVKDYASSGGSSAASSSSGDKSDSGDSSSSTPAGEGGKSGSAGSEPDRTASKTKAASEAASSTSGGSSSGSVDAKSA